MVGVFRRLFAAGFPIEELRLPGTADLEAPPTGDGNDTAGYVCRAARGQTRFSSHAYGTAIDLNPFQNPQVRRGLVLPGARRRLRRPGGPARRHDPPGRPGRRGVRGDRLDLGRHVDQQQGLDALQRRRALRSAAPTGAE